MPIQEPFSIVNLDIDGGGDIGADLEDTDLIIVDPWSKWNKYKVCNVKNKTYIGAVSTDTNTFKKTANRLSGR